LVNCDVELDFRSRREMVETRYGVMSGIALRDHGYRQRSKR
jgi:hypothetical protein